MTLASSLVAKVDSGRCGSVKHSAVSKRCKRPTWPSLPSRGALTTLQPLHLERGHSSATLWPRLLPRRTCDPQVSCCPHPLLRPRHGPKCSGKHSRPQRHCPLPSPQVGGGSGVLALPVQYQGHWPLLKGMYGRLAGDRGAGSRGNLPVLLQKDLEQVQKQASTAHVQEQRPLH